MRRESGGDTSVIAADPTPVEAALAQVGLADQETQVRNTLSASLSQAVFAKRVVLCEGHTDSVLLEAVASLDRPFEQDGIAVAECHGKSIFPVALAILRGLGIPCFVLFDADGQVKEKLEKSEKGTQADRDAQIEAIATKNRQLLELSRTGFDGDLETRIPTWKKGTPKPCHDRRNTPMSCSIAAPGWSPSPAAPLPT